MYSEIDKSLAEVVIDWFLRLVYIYLMKNIKKYLGNRKFILLVILLLITATLNFVSSELIQKYFPDRQPAQDLLFRLTPYVSWTQYLTDIANVASVLGLLIYLFMGRVSKFPRAVFAFVIAEFLRSVIIILTPLGGPLGNSMHYGLTAIQQHGEFPSGHTIIVVLSYLLVSKVEAPILKNLLLLNIIIEVISLILSRGHYSIDIVGGILVAYFAYHESGKYESKIIN